MKLYFFFSILFLYSIIICDNENNTDNGNGNEWTSPCELEKNPKSYKDCLNKTTEFIFEICCYLKGINSSNSNEEECVDISRDDTRNKHFLELAKEKIQNGTYWDDYNETYKSIELLICYGNYIFPKFILIIYFIFL